MGGPVTSLRLFFRRSPVLACALFVAIVLLQLLPSPAGFLGNSRSQGPVESGAPTELDCTIDKDRLQELRERHGLEERFEYVKRYVQFERKDVPRPSLTKLSGQNFLPHQFHIVDPLKSYHKQRCAPPLEVTVPVSPYPSRANASGFIFGVSTTFDHFHDPATNPVPEWRYWLTDGAGTSNGGKMMLLLDNATDQQVSQVQMRLQVAGIDAHVAKSSPDEKPATRHLGLLLGMREQLQLTPRKWLVLCDDDTFFPRMNALVSRMAEFDHTRPMYIGALSEDFTNIIKDGSQALGGAGIFLSLPMVDVIAANYDDCTSEEQINQLDTDKGGQGDKLLRQCIHDRSDVRLTNLWDLWQLDMAGDMAGFYESGIKPLSLHHYRGGEWHLAHPLDYVQIAFTCGEDCPFQRFQTMDDFILSTYSVAQYPKGISFDLDQMERTFGAMPDDINSNFDYVFGPQRPNLHETGRKIAWELQESAVASDGSVMQLYTRKARDERFVNKDGTPMSDVDGLVELVWIEK